jgi:hypothetical protein
LIAKIRKLPSILAAIIIKIKKALKGGVPFGEGSLPV